MDLASSLAVIGWLVQVLLDKGITFAIDHWRGAEAGPDLPEALQKLREAFNNVQALLHEARKIRSENEGLLESVKDLKDAAYDAEDILSELDYYRLQKEVEGNNSSFCSSMKAAGRRAFSQIHCKDTQASTSSPPSAAFDKKNTIRRISKVVDRLDSILANVRGVLPLLTPEEREADSHVSTSYRVTTSFVSSKETTFGREDQKAHIIDLLLNGQPPAAAASDVWVLPIIGAGGIGKTTLAREVYNDKRVAEHFDCTLWLYVSENFDVPRLTRDMLEKLSVKGSSNIKNLDQLQTLLKDNLCSKKFLLIMDDVWNDADSQKWKTLFGPLESGKTGSRILLTTRLDTVVKMVGKEAMNVFGCPVELKGLPEEEYLSLFNKYAFGDEEPSDHSNLTVIGKQIARKLDGSPLAAKTVGSLLNEKLDVEHWDSIRSSGIWKRPQSQHDIIPVLKLSYQHLPVHLQQCFAYCCVFPKGHSFDGGELVRMWIAHGYIDTKTSGKKRMEDIGWEYYKILLARSFLEKSPYSFTKFVVHDLFHDLAQSVSADESFIIDTNNQEVPSRVRHLSLSSDHITVLQKSYLRNLRTLIMFRGRKPTNYQALDRLLNELKSVRVLYLEGWWRHNIGRWIHLRYLHSPRFGKRKVTNSLCRLYHLQFAEVAEIYLYLHRIEKLTCLQELDCFIIEKGRKIGKLKNLKQLGGSLSLEKLENVSTKEEALEAELSKKMHIRNLRLKWNDSLTLPEVAEEPAYIKKAEEVFEGFRPPDYIKMLFIDGYGGVNTPTWMVREIRCFSNLETLYLLNCLKWKDLPPLVELPVLRHLTICKADAVEVIGRGFYGTGVARGFSRLETLELICMPQLVTWSGIGGDSGFLFPRLHKLLIADCPKLEQVPVKDLTSLKKVTLSSCNQLHLLPLLPAMLEVLVLHNLELLTDLTMEKLSDLTSLRKLYIKRCPHLNSLPLLPASLKILEVNECPKLPRERYQEGGEDWNNISHIPEMKWYQEDTRTLALAQEWELVREMEMAGSLERVSALAGALAGALELALALALAQELERERALEQEGEGEGELELELELARARALALALLLALPLALVLELALVQPLALALALAPPRVRARVRAWSRARSRALSRALAWPLARAQARVRALWRTLALARARASERERVLDREREREREGEWERELRKQEGEWELEWERELERARMRLLV